MTDEVKPQTPTETLLQCLERFGRAEPDRVVVVWTDEGGDLCWATSKPRTYTHMIGMLECLGAILMREFLESPE